MYASTGNNSDLLETERKQRRIAETLLKASAAVVSSLDLGEVLLTLAGQLVDISRFHTCAISEWDKENGFIRTLAEYTRAVWPVNGGERYRLSNYPVTEQVLTTGLPQIKRFGENHSETSWMREVGIATLLLLPLRAGDATIGLVEVGSPADVPEITADLISQCQHILSRAARELKSPLSANPDETLLALANELAAVKSFSWCTLSAWDQDKGEVITAVEVANANWTPGRGPLYELSDNPLIAEVLERAASTSLSVDDPQAAPHAREELEKWGAKLVVYLPLTIKGTIIGLVELFDIAKSQPVSEDELRLWRAVTDQATVAVENARLYEQARKEIEERQRIEEQLRHDSLHDPLTQIPNRILFFDRLAHAIATAKRRKGPSFAVLFLDLDNFKNINDTLGHSLGDVLLKNVAHRLVESLRLGDSVARLGGDEFAILLEDVDGIQDAILVAKRIQEYLAQPYTIEDKELSTSASIGIVLNTKGYERPEQFLRDADIAMYRAKAQGKSRYEIFDKDMREQILTRMSLKADLRLALENEELFVLYQPVIALESGQITGFEALLRWQHPTRGLIQPADFIPIAEETSQIVPIGNWVLREACTQLKNWLSRFSAPQPLPFTVSVNLSRVQLRRSKLVKSVEEILRQVSLEPSKLILEVTESSLVKDVEKAESNLANLKSSGVNVHLDDFGVGYSGLAHLSRFPLDAVKIDRSFVAHMQDEPSYAVIARAIILIGQELGLRVTAEGIETRDQFMQLRALNCDYGQGYYFSKPLTQEELTSFLEKYKADDFKLTLSDWTNP